MHYYQRGKYFISQRKFTSRWNLGDLHLRLLSMGSLKAYQCTAYCALCVYCVVCDVSLNANVSGESEIVWYQL